MERRPARFLPNPPHANSDNIRSIFGTLPLAEMLKEESYRRASDAKETAPARLVDEGLAIQTMDRLENAMRRLEDIYAYVTNAEAQAHARVSTLAELGKYILEAKKAADGTIEVFQHTLQVDSEPSPITPKILTAENSFSVASYEIPEHKEAHELPRVKSIKKSPSPKNRRLNMTRKSSFLEDNCQLRENELHLLKALHAEFHAKKAEFKMLRRRVDDAEKRTKVRLQDDESTLRSLHRLKLDLQ
ncbi:hypothetical protein Ae201684_005791 [Aphanomyces euteiches]|uniref:Uncharacterized protein n=1 Tax=Aphanomyces euteiches TaxID=100861 RepID=A0A6G0XE55_9STRA|nr:hypothetical protein Ae201684_005791 [Aphanomyces euteiches]